LRSANLLSAARLLRYVTACVLLAAASAYAGAQTRTGEANATRPAETTSAEADEEFDLNIEQRRISEKEFHAETAVETEGERGLRLGVGVALRASEIEVLLLGVRGHVRFRGSLAPVLRLLEARRGTPKQTPPP
jgi:osmotically-inducible protein OsmY